MKLNIYEKNKITKTYEAEAYELMFGTVEDVLRILDEHEGINLTDGVAITELLTDIVRNGMDTIIKPIMFEAFEGITEDDLKHTKFSEIVDVLLQIVMYSFEQLGMITAKNLRGRQLVRK